MIATSEHKIILGNLLVFQMTDIIKIHTVQTEHNN